MDTDGYDSDCIMSFEDNLKNISPVLYWENEIDNPDQLQKYLRLADYLHYSGYRKFYVFDNYGNHLVNTDADGLKDLDWNLWRMLRGASGRTFYYVDVLAAKPERSSCCDIAVSQYLKRYN